MEAELRDLVYADIKTFSNDAGLPVHFPNVAPRGNEIEVIGPTDQNIKHYLRVSTLPVTAEVKGSCSGFSIYRWIVQISVYARDGVGELKSLRYVDAIRDYFRFNTQLVGVNNTYTVVTPVSTNPSIASKGWYFIPTQFRVTTVH